MNFSNFLQFLRQNKNVIQSQGDERVMFDLHLDNTTRLRRACITQTVALGGAASVNLTNSLPAGARVLFAGIFLETAVTLTTAVKLGVGTAATPNAFFLSSTVMTIGATQILAVADTNARVAAATPIQLTTTDTSGALAGTGVGSVKVMVVYEFCQPITA